MLLWRFLAYYFKEEYPINLQDECFPFELKILNSRMIGNPVFFQMFIVILLNNMYCSIALTIFRSFKNMTAITVFFIMANNLHKGYRAGGGN